MTNSSTTSGTQVLVTGGSGFIAIYCIIDLLKAGYTVRTTIRSAGREEDVLAMLKTAGIDADDKLSFFIADLTKDEGWKEAVSGCEYVLHVASPFPQQIPKDENELIIPARDGTLRVLRAATDSGVKRVVLTSSFAAIGYSPKTHPGPYTETDWTNVADNPAPYVKSKTIAEKAAWDFMAKEGGNMELSVINPVGVFGPILGTDFSSSVHIIKRFLTGELPALPKISASAVDVRDVARLHLLAMTHPAAKGERFIAVAGNPMTFPEVGALLRKELGEKAAKVPTRILPNWLVKIMALRSQQAKQIAGQLNKVKDASNEKAVKVLGWKPRSNEEAILATAESLIKFGVVT